MEKIKNKQNKHMKLVYIIDALIIVGTIIAIFGTLGYFGYLEPLIIAPIDDLVTSNTSVLFSFENADTIYIDDNMNFTSPEKIYVENGLEVKLEPGTYYWKIEGVFESEIRKFTILSRIDLQLREAGYEYYEVVNSGNIRLNVEVYDENETMIDELLLEVDESEKTQGNKFIGVQNE
jgi:hypothetical protein